MGEKRWQQLIGLCFIISIQEVPGIKQEEGVRGELLSTKMLIAVHEFKCSGKVYCSHTGISLMCPILRFRSEYGIRIVMHHGHHLALEVSRSTIYAVTAG